MRLFDHDFPGKDTFFLIAGNCVIEDIDTLRRTAETLRDACGELKIPLIFKASFDKANRSSVKSYRGPGMDVGLEMLARIREEYSLPIISDVHAPEQAAPCAEVLDFLQIPAFLSRQTDLLVACGETGKPVNVKKSQIASPSEMGNVVDKVKSTGNDKVMLTDRGTFFGYNNLVADLRNLVVMKTEFGVPVVLDATHSLQRPGGLGNKSGGDSWLAPNLIWAGLAMGADGIFMETHPDPDNAKSDGPNSVPLIKAHAILKTARDVYAAVKEGGC